LVLCLVWYIHLPRLLRPHNALNSLSCPSLVLPQADMVSNAELRGMNVDDYEDDFM